MKITQQEVMAFIRENDVKFIRLAFCDLFGTMKNVSILPQQIGRAFDGGVSFDAAAVKGFAGVANSDMFLKPDPSTLSILPWLPQAGGVIRMLCDCTYADGSPFEAYSREILRHQEKKAAQMGYEVKIGTECEFYLFEADEKGRITQTPQDEAGYMDVAPLDKGENVRREICLSLEAMHIQPETSHHEQGPGQNEIDFRCASPLQAADEVITFKTAVRAVAAQYGLCASFMPKPLKNQCGNGMHVNFSLHQEGRNLFELVNDQLQPEAAWAIAGILNRIREISLFLNPIPNSYQRLGQCEAPGYVSWSLANRSQLIRIPAAKGDAARMEVRSPDCACNPYLAFALLIAAALEGIDKKLPLPNPVDEDVTGLAGELYNLEKLPQDIGQAIQLAKTSEFIKHVLPTKMVEKYLQEEESIWNRSKQAPHDLQAYHFRTI